MGVDHTLLGVCIEHVGERMIFFEVRFGEMPVGMHGHTCRARIIMVECPIEQWFTRRWCHLPTVGVACGLYLVRDCHGLNGEGILPWILWMCGEIPSFSSWMRI